MSIYLTALIKSKPGQAEELKKLLLELQAGSRSEEACIQYDLHQSKGDENLFLFHEEWTDEAGLANHNEQPHISCFLEASKEILDGAPILHHTNKVA